MRNLELAEEVGIAFELPTQYWKSFLTGPLQKELDGLSAEGKAMSWRLINIHDHSKWKNDSGIFEAWIAFSHDSEVVALVKSRLRSQLDTHHGRWTEPVPLTREYLENRFGPGDGIRLYRKFETLDTRLVLKLWGADDDSSLKAISRRVGLATFVFYLDAFQIPVEQRADLLRGWIRFLVRSYEDPEAYCADVWRAAEEAYKAHPLYKELMSEYADRNWGEFNDILIPFWNQACELGDEFQKLCANGFKPKQYTLLVYNNFIHLHSFRLGLTVREEASLAAIASTFYRDN